VISFVAQIALENIATSDAAYHDVNHTIMVTLVGQEILRGRLPPSQRRWPLRSPANVRVELDAGEAQAVYRGIDPHTVADLLETLELISVSPLWSKINLVRRPISQPKWSREQFLMDIRCST
jgi:hypothetical protein